MWKPTICKSWQLHSLRFFLVQVKELLVQTRLCQKENLLASLTEEPRGAAQHRVSSTWLGPVLYLGSTSLSPFSDKLCLSCGGSCCASSPHPASFKKKKIFFSLPGAPHTLKILIGPTLITSPPLNSAPWWLEVGVIRQPWVTKFICNQTQNYAWGIRSETGGERISQKKTRVPLPKERRYSGQLKSHKHKLQ